MKPHELKSPRGLARRGSAKGRGEAAGKGKTAGRGTKGTKARGEVHAFFEGGQMPLVRRVPKLKGFTPPSSKIYGAVNVGKLNELEGDEFSAEELHAAGLVHKRDKLIKVLGNGEIDRAITVELTLSASRPGPRSKQPAGTIELLDAANRQGPR